MATSVRRSPIAGTWYPGRAVDLERMVRELLESVEPRPVDGELLALVSPHAGLRYSGAVAAAGYRLLERHHFETAVLIGPSHHVYFQGASVYDQGAFETPLGQVPIDEELARAVLQASERVIRRFPEAHDREHCLEMQLPFLQVLDADLRIVPIMMGDQRRANVKAVTESVIRAVTGSNRRILFIASSDLSHYKSAESAAILDGKVATLVQRFDSTGLMTLLEENHEHACGGGPMVAVMEVARRLGGNAATIVRYGDSGDVTGDKTEVVGYLSAALYRRTS